MTLGNSQEVTLTLNTHISSLSSLVPGHSLQLFLKNQQFSLFLLKSLSYIIWPCRKIGQDQPRIIIWINYDGQESPILHAKFRENRSISSGEKDFWMVFTIYIVVAAILVMWPASY